jgi:hypothetical protein
MAESIYESAEGYDKEKFLLAHVVEIVTPAWYVDPWFVCV